MLPAQAPEPAPRPGAAKGGDTDRIFDRPPRLRRVAAALNARCRTPIAAADIDAGLDTTIDFAGATGISGWIWNPYQPQKRIALELFDGDQLLTTVLANQAIRSCSSAT